MPAFHHKKLLLYVFILCCLCCTILAQEGLLQGNYTLAKIVDAQQAIVPLHGKSYTFSLHFQNATTNGSVYLYGIVIGNSIGGSMDLDETNGTVTDTTSWSTKMYPGRRLSKIETALLNAVDQANMFEERNKFTLVLSGDGGSFTLKRDGHGKTSKRKENATMGMGMKRHRSY
jgi:hypothetical protein